MKGPGKIIPLPRTQLQAHRLIVIDLGSCHRLIYADFVSLSIAFNERDHDVGMKVIRGRQRSSREDNSM